MNTKSSWIVLVLLVLAIIFVPIVPNDVPIECVGDDISCDSPAAYVSVYDKFLK